MNIAGATYSGSVNTRFYRGNCQLPTGSDSLPVFTNTFGLDPQNPFHRIFAAQISNASENAYITQFVFSLGGVAVGNPQSIVWGYAATYNASILNDATSGLNITPFFGNDAMEIHSQYAGGCTLLLAETGADIGFLSRWTALADQIVLTTTSAGVWTETPEANELVHGVIQQPF